ncbi:hypothetical protein B0A61_09905, partial [Flavobacterium aquatile LMG 4008 = ATCC 11947]
MAKFKQLVNFLVLLFMIGMASNQLNAQDYDNDGVINHLDLDDDNDGIYDSDECGNWISVPDLSMVSWQAKNGGIISNINIGDVFTSSNFVTINGITYDLRFELISRYPSTGTGSTYTVSLDPEITIDGGRYDFGSHIIYDIRLVEASSVTPSNLAGISGFFEEMKIEIRDLDNGSANRTDVGAFISPTPFSFSSGIYIGDHTLANGQIVWGLNNFSVINEEINNTNPSPNYSITGTMSNVTNARLLHGIYGTSTSISAARLSSLKISVKQCSGIDTDGDNVPDYLDLDSDNDGCPDAIEGGENVILSQLNANGSISGTVDANGVPTTVGTVGQDVGQSQDSTKNDCLDTDGDGVSDWQDIDDDNDGILDAEESPNCFYTVFEANQLATVTSSLNGASSDPLSGNDIPFLYNDNNNDGTTTTAYNFAGSQTITSGSAIFTVKYPTPIAIKSLTAEQAANGMASSGFAKLYGSNDGINYTLLTVGNGISIATTSVIFNNTATTEYLYYQIRYIGTVATGNTTSVSAGTTAIHEIYSLAATTPIYNPSAHPKPGFCTVDLDGDTIPNHLDSDSDGDGCSDAYEGGASLSSNVSIIPGLYGVNGLANSLETSLESGVVNYISTYRKYAANISQVLCLDTDYDSVPNPIDLDDDNDGVLDIDEGDFCGKLNRNIRVGYLDTTVGRTGLATNLLYNLNNFGVNGVYNKVRGVTLIPFATAASVTETNLLAQNIDIFFVGSSASNAITSADKIPTSVNTILTTWAKNNGKGIFALQNNAIDYGYTVTNNNVNPNTSVGVLGRDYYTNGYWPTAALNQSGSVQMTIKSSTREFDFLMLDANLRPVVISDREYNLVIFPDATIYNNEAANATPSTNDQNAIADTWAYVFDKFLATQCTYLNTDNDVNPNYLDLDSDNDGCSDAIEAGATNSTISNFAFTTQGGTATDSNNDGLADIIDANLNGIPDYLSTYEPQSIDNTITKCTDSDGDGYFNINDLDDDNDGILDNDEGLSCNSLNRNLRIGYVNTTIGTNGLMVNLLSNSVNFGLTGTYSKFPGITFVPYATEAAVTESQLLTDEIDVFYVGSSAADAQTNSDKLLSATNIRILAWASNNDKGVVVLQNNATDYGYIVNNVYPNSNPSTPYGPLGESVFINGYWPVTTFDMSGVVQMSINSALRRYETAMADVQGKATFIKDRDLKIVFIPDATIFISNQAVSTIGTNATLKVAADVWAFAFDTFLKGIACTSSDYDADGIPNHLDLDSDNDGCSDANEYYNSSQADGNDDGVYYVGTPIVDANGQVTTASYTGNYINVINSNVFTACTIDAVNDGSVSIASTNSPLLVTNVLSNDTLSGSLITTINTNVTPGTTGPLSVNANGDVTLASNTPSGTYTITYQLCEADSITGLNVSPANCDSASITVVVCGIPTLSAATQPTCTVATGSFSITNYNTLYAYTFSPSTGVVQSGANVTAQAGTYTVTATLGDCTSLASSNVTIDAQPPTPVQPILSTATQPTCATASGSFTITNYNSAYTYTVTPSTGVSISGNTITAPAGTYTVTATLGVCTSVASSSVAINAQPAIPVQPLLSTATQPTCAISTGGFSITNYNALYSYTFSPSIGVVQSGANVTATAGTYTVTATLGDCTSVVSSNVTIDAQPATPVQPILSTATQPTCATASGSFTITNYNSAYTYTVSPSTEVSISGNTITAPAGTYTVTATLGACTSIVSSNVIIDGQAATPVQPILSAVTQPTCTVATGSFTITNYNAVYTYNVSPATGVSISGNTITAPAGTYTVTATLGACTSIVSSNVTIDAQSATPVQPILSAATPPTCTVATGSFTITNYNAVYTYNVSPATGVSISGNTITAPPGTYTVTATLGACKSLISDNITITNSICALPDTNPTPVNGTTGGDSGINV